MLVIHTEGTYDLMFSGFNFRNLSLFGRQTHACIHTQRQVNRDLSSTDSFPKCLLQLELSQAKAGRWQCSPGGWQGSKYWGKVPVASQVAL